MGGATERASGRASDLIQTSRFKEVLNHCVVKENKNHFRSSVAEEKNSTNRNSRGNSLFLCSKEWLLLLDIHEFFKMRIHLFWSPSFLKLIIHKLLQKTGFHLSSLSFLVFDVTICSSTNPCFPPEGWKWILFVLIQATNQDLSETYMKYSVSMIIISSDKGSSI